MKRVILDIFCCNKYKLVSFFSFTEVDKFVDHLLNINNHLSRMPWIEIIPNRRQRRNSLSPADLPVAQLSICFVDGVSSCPTKGLQIGQVHRSTNLISFFPLSFSSQVGECSQSSTTTNWQRKRAATSTATMQ